MRRFILRPMEVKSASLSVLQRETAVKIVFFSIVIFKRLAIGIACDACGADDVDAEGYDVDVVKYLMSGTSEIDETVDANETALRQRRE